MKEYSSTFKHWKLTELCLFQYWGPQIFPQKKTTTIWCHFISLVLAWIHLVSPQISSLVPSMCCKEIIQSLSNIENWLSNAKLSSISRLVSLDFAPQHWLYSDISFVPGWIFLISPQISSSVTWIWSKQLLKYFWTFRTIWVVPNSIVIYDWVPYVLPQNIAVWCDIFCSWMNFLLKLEWFFIIDVILKLLEYFLT